MSKGTALALCKLGDVCGFQNGRAFKPSDWSDAGMPIIRIQNLNRRDASFNHWAGSLKGQVLIYPGDLLLAWSGTPGTSFGAHIWNGPKGVLNQHIFLVQCDERRIDREFCLHVINSKLGTLILKAHGGVGLQHFTRKVIIELEISLPPLEEQRRIVSLLNRAANIRHCTNTSHINARAVIPALFLEMFGNPATNPKGWPMMTVGEVLDSASYGTSQKASETSAGLPVIRMGNVTLDGELDTVDLKYAELTERDREKAELLDGDLLFNRTNSKELVGKTGLWDGRFEAVAASYFIRLRVSREHIAPAYLWAFFNTSHMKRVLFQTARGAVGQANINAKELRAFPLAVPPLPLQITFAEQAKRLDAIACALNIAAAKAEAMKSALSARLFS